MADTTFRVGSRVTHRNKRPDWVGTVVCKDYDDWRVWVVWEPDANIARHQSSVVGVVGMFREDTDQLMEAANG
jgi:hypothetical protein